MYSKERSVGSTKKNMFGKLFNSLEWKKGFKNHYSPRYAIMALRHNRE